MNALLTLLIAPLLLMTAALLRLPPRRLSRLGACLMTLQAILVIHNCGSYVAIADAQAHVVGGFRLDSTAAFFLILTTLVMAAALVHAVFFFDAELAGPHPPTDRDVRAVYVFAPLFLLSMYGVVAADNLGYLWISMEASTLLSAPLVYYHRSRTALEATWKYLIVCSVGIAFAFFGTAILYGVSQQVAGLADGSLSIAALTRQAGHLSGPLVRFSFVFMLLGYGTKAGLFPLHSWLPDAHSEAPAPISALLSGALLNCALVALWRVANLMVSAGQQAFVHATLLPMALMTVVASSLFLIKQQDFKRLWAYSSMENVGLMAVAISLGAGTAFGQQAINHSAVKVALFLLAGNILQELGTKKIASVHGLLVSRPAQASLLLFGSFAVAGTPPFGSFVAEWNIIRTAADAHQFAAVAILLLSLAIAFVALSIPIVSMLLGTPSKPRDGVHEGVTNPRLSVAVPCVLLVAAFALGLLLAPACLTMTPGPLP